MSWWLSAWTTNATTSLKFSADHKCKSKDVFLLVLDDGAETEAMADELGISLHALIGIDVVDTMKLHIQISDQCWWCSWTQAPPTPSSRKRWCPTSAFGWCHDGGWPLRLPTAGLTIKAANGERVVSQGVCKEADMVIDVEHFIIDLYVLPLDDFNIVLGVQWLHTLGPIVWYFGALAMSF
jgi:hypothetical protein